MKGRRGRITCQQRLIPLVLNRKLPDGEEGVWGYLVPHHLYN